MELLIMKSTRGYVRVSKDGYDLCDFHKASVFPLDKIDAVKVHLEKLNRGDLAPVSINRLVIMEEPFMDSQS